MASMMRCCAFAGLFSVLSLASCQQAEGDDVGTAVEALGGQCNISCRDGTQLVRSSGTIGSNSGIAYLMGYAQCQGEMECASHGGFYGVGTCFYY